MINVFGLLDILRREIMSIPNLLITRSIVLLIILSSEEIENE